MLYICLCVYRCPGQILTPQGGYISFCVIVNEVYRKLFVPLVIISIGYNNILLTEANEICCKEVSYNLL